MKIIICILNYHQVELVKRLLTDLISQKISNCYIYIGDVQPSYDEEKNINKYIENIGGKNVINYFTIDKNLGYACGNNLIIKKAMMHIDNIDYVVICNPDIRVQNENLLSDLLKKMKCINDCAIIGPKVITPSNRQQGPYLEPNIKLYILKHFLPFLWYPFWLIRERHISKIINVQKVWRIIGAFMIIDFNVFNRIQFFDENTFLYWEEDILSLKLKSINKHVYFDPSCEINHVHGSNGVKTVSRYDIESMSYYFSSSGENKIWIEIAKLSVKFYNMIRKHI